MKSFSDNTKTVSPQQNNIANNGLRRLKLQADQI